jgi:hypothetical protein
MRRTFTFDDAEERDGFTHAHAKPWAWHTRVPHRAYGRPPAMVTDRPPLPKKAPVVPILTDATAADRDEIPENPPHLADSTGPVAIGIRFAIPARSSISTSTPNGRLRWPASEPVFR